MSSSVTFSGSTPPTNNVVMLASSGGVNFWLGRSFARLSICSATGSFVPKYLSLIFCFLNSGAALSSGMCVSPLQGRYGQSFLVHAFLNQNVHIGDLFLL